MIKLRPILRESAMSEEYFINCGTGWPCKYLRQRRQDREGATPHFNDSDAPSWKIEARGKQFSPFRKACLAAFSLTEKSRAYSENRIKYPMIRVDFDPKGDRNPHKRGKSGYRRISCGRSPGYRCWRDEAYPRQLRRLQLLCQGHHLITTGHYRLSNQRLAEVLQPDWVYRNSGQSRQLGGLHWELPTPSATSGGWVCLNNTTCWTDALQNAEMDSLLGQRSRFDSRGLRRQESAIWRVWLKELGVKQVHIDPYCNYTAATQADKWIAPRPGNRRRHG